MARKGLTGQLNMFDFFRELENTGSQAEEVEMVSLMPDYEEVEMETQAAKLTGEPLPKETSAESKQPAYTSTINSDRPVMKRSYTTNEGTLEIAYISYNKVQICEPQKEPQITEFASSKEAVDYYVEQMQKLEALYGEE